MIREIEALKASFEEEFPGFGALLENQVNMSDEEDVMAEDGISRINHMILLKGVFCRLSPVEDHLFLTVSLLHCCVVCSLCHYVSHLRKSLPSIRTTLR